MDSDIDVPVQIFDTTLRDGEQTPGVAFAADDKIAIAKRLDALGTHVIEAGFPVNSDEEFEAVSRIAETVGGSVCGLARVMPHDVDVAVRPTSTWRTRSPPRPTSRSRSRWAPRARGASTKSASPSIRSRHRGKFACSAPWTPRGPTPISCWR